MDLSGIQLLLDAAAAVSGCANISQYIKDIPNVSKPTLSSMPSVGCYEEVFTSESPDAAAALSGCGNNAPSIESNPPLNYMPSEGCYEEVSSSVPQGSPLDLSRTSDSKLCIDVSFKNVHTSTPKKRLLLANEPLDLRSCPASKQKPPDSFSSRISPQKIKGPTAQDLRTNNSLRGKNSRDPRSGPPDSKKDRSLKNIAHDPHNKSFWSSDSSDFESPLAGHDLPNNSSASNSASPRDSKPVQSGNKTSSFSASDDVGSIKQVKHDLHGKIVRDLRDNSFNFSVAGNVETSCVEIGPLGKIAHNSRKSCYVGSSDVKSPSVQHDLQIKSSKPIQSSSGPPDSKTVRSFGKIEHDSHNKSFWPSNSKDLTSSLAGHDLPNNFSASTSTSSRDPKPVLFRYKTSSFTASGDSKPVQSRNKNSSFSASGDVGSISFKHDLHGKIAHDRDNSFNVSVTGDLESPLAEHELSNNSSASTSTSPRDPKPVQFRYKTSSFTASGDVGSITARHDLLGKIAHDPRNTSFCCSFSGDVESPRVRNDPQDKSFIPPAPNSHGDIAKSDSESESGDVDDDDQEVRIGDLTLFNEFIVEEYFEKYQNLTLMFDDDEPVIMKENRVPGNGINQSDKPKSARTVTTNIGSSSAQPLNEVHLNEGDLGFDEIDTDYVPPKKPKTNQRKLTQYARMRGLEYRQSNGRGAMVAARSVKPPCSCMNLKCYTKYEDSTRKKLLENLLKLSTSGQNQFLSNHIAIRTTARPKILNSRRLFSRSYFLPGFNGRIKVCKDMFMSTFDVKDKKIRLLAEKQLIGRGISADDLRSQNGTHKALSEEELEYVSQHIRSFPAYTSHYGREKSSKLYLSSDLSVLKMYGLYKQKCVEDYKQPVHYTTYRRVFKKMNIGFRKPKIDTCGECDKFVIALKISDEVKKAEIEALREIHHNRAQEAYRQKKADVNAAKSDVRYRTASFDLQKCLATPHLNTGVAYYKRQLYTLNLTVFSTNNGNNTVNCFIWDESKAKRGSQEIGSCLLKDLSSMDPLVEEVVYYSDRCAGQNHNYIICMALQAFIERCRNEGRSLIIYHKFMTSGHSHMEVDSAHAAIEKAKKRCSINIETPRDWAVFIGAIHRKVPFTVNEMEQSEFLALKNLDEFFTRPKKNCDNELIKFKDISAFKYCTDHPGIVFYKYDLSDAEFKSFSMRKDPNVPVTLPPPITDEPIPLSEEKLQDLRELMEYVSNKAYYATLLKEIIPKKRGRRSKSDKVDHFDDDLDLEEPDIDTEM